MTSTRPTLAVGMVGYAFMGAAHSQAWRTAPRFFDLPLHPDHAGRLRPRRRADRRGGRPARLGRDRDGLAPRSSSAPDVDLVDICTPGDTHAEIAIAALEAGKHVLCEKPLANTVAEAEAMTAAAEQAAQHGVRAMVGFTYRRVPAIALARRLVAEGRIGEVRHVRAQYLQDWIADPEAPLSWRLDKAKAGSGALGDIGAHIVDLTQHITGERITEVSGQLETFVKERPIATEHAGLSGVGGRRARTGHRRRRRGRSSPGSPAAALGVFEATRFATGRKNAIRIEINGSRRQPGLRLRGHERPGVLRRRRARRDRRLPADPRHRARATPTSAPGGRPATGSATSTASPTRSSTWSPRSPTAPSPTPTFADGLQVQRVLAAVETSSDTRTWQEIPA